MAGKVQSVASSYTLRFMVVLSFAEGLGGQLGVGTDASCMILLSFSVTSRIPCESTGKLAVIVPGLHCTVKLNH